MRDGVSGVGKGGGSWWIDFLAGVGMGSFVGGCNSRLVDLEAWVLDL